MDGRKGETTISRVTRPMLQSAKCLFAERPEREKIPQLLSARILVWI
jgi:hypothetical protein